MSTCIEEVIPQKIDKPTELASTRPYTCSYEGCSAAFGKPSRLEQHIRVHTGERPFKCHQCDQSYTRSFHLKRHVLTTHEKTAVQVFMCPVEGCGKQFASTQKLRIHHAKTHTDKRLKCPFCEKVFIKNQQLKVHQYQHTGILPYNCEFEECGKQFLLPSKLKAHSKTHKGYTCDEENCHQHFNVWSALRKHKSEAHPKKYICSVCNTSFKRPGFLKSHIKKHQPDREVFHCPYDNCPRWSYYKKNLVKHIDYYHNPGQFKCEEIGCDKVFNWKASLIAHSARHKLPVPENNRKRKQSSNCKPRKPRCDLGQPKKAIAAILSGHPVSQDESKRLMRNVD